MRTFLNNSCDFLTLLLFGLAECMVEWAWEIGETDDDTDGIL